MFLFPVIYIAAFISSIYYLLKDKVQGILLFFVFGLPIYTIALSVSFMYGFRKYIPLLQSFKEIIVLVGLGYLVLALKKKLRLHLVDKLIIAFFLFTALYVILPIGKYGFIDKLLALKSLSFFVFVYFIGRLFDPKKIYINQYFKYICAVSIAAAIVLLYELINYQHIQTLSGYADYNYYLFNQEPSGNYGLTWTFEIEGGLKRFASFFSNPLEHSAATILTVSILAALYTKQNNSIKLDAFGIIVLLSTILGIVFALSRASFVNYFLLIYIYAFITDKKIIIKIIHWSIFIALLYPFIFIKQNDLGDFLINTFKFNSTSSLGHILGWIEGAQAIIKSPLGLGLGESGRISGMTGENIGGENQLVIIGVQAGVIALGLYIAVYVLLIKTSYRSFKIMKGKERKIALALLLMKIGFIIPTITSNFESYIYISYISWFISGLFITMISNRSQSITFESADVKMKIIS